MFAMNSLSYCFNHHGKHKEALEILQKAYEIDPEEHETNFNLGLQYLDHVHDYDKSLEYFKCANESADDDN